MLTRMTTQLPVSPSRATVPAFENAWLAWRLESPVEPRILTVAELAECVCPELCNRDHDNE